MSVAQQGALVRRVHIADPGPDAATRIRAELGEGPLSLVAVFAAPSTAFAALIADLTDTLAGTTVIGCITAGEINDGYREGGIVAIALPVSHFETETVLIPNLHALDPDKTVRNIIRKRAALKAVAPHWNHEFAILLIDGLSRREDAVVAMVMHGLGQVPLFGGSSGDGTRFTTTAVGYDGKVMENVAVITCVRTICPVKVFSLDNLTPTDRRMVVTRADPEARIVHEINAENAASEYARLLGKDPAQLDPFTFAAHPVVVRFGGRHHVRAIQRVTGDGALVFFSAIDEGMVLTLATSESMADHLGRELSALSATAVPDTIIAFDCILRRIEAEQKQQTGAVSQVLADHNVVGFSTYGEQHNGLHINQTMTGVAIYPPGAIVR
ncbi:MAG: FIST C-terminal domain-containing protein [Alphaproteobacteria bacterium]|nr:FIST C-terminal domain-containing protein [Alphaproteobacteria bacterium]